VSSYFNAAGQPRVVFLDNKDARILDPETGKELYKLDGGAGIQVSPDGKYLMRLKAKGKDEQKFAVEIWKLEGE
jgi:hypothetical protein